MKTLQNRNDTNFLRFLAIVLIVNSHLSSLYPFPQIATGGSIGNALFFMLSGYGLMMSEKHKKKSFFMWYGRRISRIYPSLILAVILLNIFPQKVWLHWGVMDYIEYLIWPTQYWFISAIMVFYIIYFFFIKQPGPKIFFLGIGALAIAYGYFHMTSVDLSKYSIEGRGYFKWIFYLQIMLFGGYLASKNSKFVKVSETNGILLLLVCVVLYYGTFLLILRGYCEQFQAIMHLLMFPIMFLFLKVSRSKFIVNNLMDQKYLSAAISLVGGLTVEIYLPNITFLTQPTLRPSSFPANIVVFWVELISAAFILNRSSSFLTRYFATTPLEPRFG